MNSRCLNNDGPLHKELPQINSSLICYSFVWNLLPVEISASLIQQPISEVFRQYYKKKSVIIFIGMGMVSDFCQVPLKNQVLLIPSVLSTNTLGSRDCSFFTGTQWKKCEKWLWTVNNALSREEPRSSCLPSILAFLLLPCAWSLILCHRPIQN